MSIPCHTLSNGMKMPSVGLGTYKEADPTKLVTAIKAALAAGYRHFDCAYVYENEHIIGKALNDAIAESNGQLKREDLFITSKVWNTFHSKSAVETHLDDCLKKFGFDYLDLLLMHWPMGFQEGGDGFIPVGDDGKAIKSEHHYTETYEAMESAVAQGKVRSIGLSNFNVDQCKKIMEVSKVKPVVNQFEINPLLQNNELVDYCQSVGIAVTGFAPLGAADRAWAEKNDPLPLENPVILEIAARVNKSPAQVILRWLIQRDIIVIPKSATPSRIVQNAALFDFELTAEDMNIFKTQFPNEFRFYIFDIADTHPDYPFKN